MPALSATCAQRLEELEKMQRLRRMPAPCVADGAWLQRGNTRVLNFASNDYLGLAQHPAVCAAAAHAAAASASSSRLVVGNVAEYTPLEAALAAYQQQEAACVFSSGYAANLGTIAALVGRGDAVIADKLSHACMIDGAQLSGATLARFAHNDLAHAERLLQQHRPQARHCLLMTEAIFSMDGDAAPLQALAALANAYDAWLLVDVAHCLHPLPPLGCENLVIVGTLSKALGSVGGYVAAAAPVVEYLHNAARSLMFSTGLPPAVLAASHAAVQCAQHEPQHAQRAEANAQHLARRLNLPTPAAAIVPLVVGASQRAVQLSAQLAEAGFAVPAIRPPTVPEGTARLRISCTALHTPEQIDTLADAILAAMAEAAA